MPTMRLPGVAPLPDSSKWIDGAQEEREEHCTATKMTRSRP
jgi:hypothetical protein